MFMSEVFEVDIKKNGEIKYVKIINMFSFALRDNISN